MSLRAPAAAALATAVSLVAPMASAEPRRLVLDTGTSSFTVHVGRAGLFGFLGHDHVVEVRPSGGHVIVDPEDLSASRVEITLAAGDLRVTDPDGPQEDVPEVQATMEGEKVLHVAEHPWIAFRSTAVRGEPIGPDAWRLEVEGELELRGVTRSLTVPVSVRFVEHGLAAAGEVVLKQSGWGIEPVSVAGVVNVKDELRIRFEIQARPETP